MPLAIVLTFIVTSVVIFLLNSEKFSTEARLNRLSRIQSEELSRNGLESLLTHMRNLVTHSINGSTLCSFIPRVGGSGNCDTTSNTFTPTLGSMTPAPFSDWTTLEPMSNLSPTAIQQERIDDANKCGISGNFQTQSQWPSDLIRNLPITFYMPGGSGQAGSVAQSVSILNTANLGSIPDDQLNVQGNGYTLEAWVFMPGSSISDRSWQRVFDIAGQTPAGNWPNSNIVLGWAGTSGRLSLHHYIPDTRNSGFAGDNNSCNWPTINKFCLENEASCGATSNLPEFPSNIWTHVVASVSQDRVYVKVFCNDTSKDKGVNNTWKAAGDNVPSNGTAGSAVTTTPSSCTNNVKDISSPVARTWSCSNGSFTQQSATTYALSSSNFQINSASPRGGSAYSKSFVGRSNWTQDGYTLGYFHNVRIWKRALSPDEIIYNENLDLNDQPVSDTLSRSISGIARSGNVVTITTSARHFFNTGSILIVSNLPQGGTNNLQNYNGNFAVTRLSDTTFSFNTSISGSDFNQSLTVNNNSADANATRSTAGASLLNDQFLRSSIRVSPRYDYDTHWLRFFTVIEAENPNNLPGQSFPNQYRLLSCAWSKAGTKTIATHSTTLRYGLNTDQRGTPVIMKNY